MHSGVLQVKAVSGLVAVLSVQSLSEPVSQLELKKIELKKCLWSDRNCMYFFVIGPTTHPCQNFSIVVHIN